MSKVACVRDTNAKRHTRIMRPQVALVSTTVAHMVCVVTVSAAQVKTRLSAIMRFNAAIAAAPTPHSADLPPAVVDVAAGLGQSDESGHVGGGRGRTRTHGWLSCETTSTADHTDALASASQHAPCQNAAIHCFARVQLRFSLWRDALRLFPVATERQNAERQPDNGL